MPDIPAEPEKEPGVVRHALSRAGDGLYSARRALAGPTPEPRWWSLLGWFMAIVFMVMLVLR